LRADLERAAVDYQVVLDQHLVGHAECRGNADCVGSPEPGFTRYKDREALLAFYDFRAKHLKHLRTTNSAGSTFATIATIRCLSRRTGLTMSFRLCQSAQRRWRLDGPIRLDEVVRGIRFVDGEPHLQNAA
jgi:hypothetical protein